MSHLAIDFLTAVLLSLAGSTFIHPNRPSKKAKIVSPQFHRRRLFAPGAAADRNLFGEGDIEAQTLDHRGSVVLPPAPAFAVNSLASKRRARLHRPLPIGRHRI